MVRRLEGATIDGDHTLVEAVLLRLLSCSVFLFLLVTTLTRASSTFDTTLTPPPRPAQRLPGTMTSNGQLKRKVVVTFNLPEAGQKLLDEQRNEVEIVQWPKTSICDHAWLLDQVEGADGLLVSLVDKVRGRSSYRRRTPVDGNA